MSLSNLRKQHITVANFRPGGGFIWSFLRHNSTLTLKRQAKMENIRAEAMKPYHLAKTFATLSQVYKKYGIVRGEKVFNLDESGFSVINADRACTKAVFEMGG